MIAMSKQSKAIRKMEKDAQLDNTDNLNKLFVRLQGQGILNTSTRDSQRAGGGDNDYDHLVSSLIVFFS